MTHDDHDDTHRLYDNRHTTDYNERQPPRIEIHPHALHTHHIERSQIESAFATRIGPARIRSRDRNAEPPRWATIGFDQQQRLIELVYVKTADPEPLVIHANYLTKGFFKEWSKA
ncbi:hypothetical protein [Bifidobacterium parmae]|uniref:Toxin n=1 Tax=Bifidobacterium parmae TaxID=361854 RepID=A0A2N5J497_9BIFI|nr:hypothetical protein [Bifidobacterium parmae]PLS29042.1 hypothetical protein Uis4E_0775 [Bifidobacterium parmae]